MWLSAGGGEGRTPETKLMVRLLTHLAGLPQNGSRFSFPTPPEIHRNRQWLAYIPRWRGEAAGQVATSLNVGGPKENESS